jgi:hypothetical protein
MHQVPKLMFTGSQRSLQYTYALINASPGLPSCQINQSHLHRSRMALWLPSSESALPI